MDYILNRIQEKIDFADEEQKARIINLYRVWFEYLIIQHLAIEYFKHGSGVSPELQMSFFCALERPSAGKLLDLCDMLCGNNTKNKTFNELLEKYVHIRNVEWAHDFVSNDEDEDELLKKLKDLCEEIENSGYDELSGEYDIIFVQKKDEEGNYRGLQLHSNGNKERWSDNGDFYLRNVYLSKCGRRDLSRNYIRLSPFICLDGDGDEILLFKSIREKLLGSVDYTNPFHKLSSPYFKEWKEWVKTDVEVSDRKRLTSNGTIINNYEDKECEGFVNVGTEAIQEQLKEFFKDRTANCAVLQGNGGVGKTTTVKKLCKELAYGSEKTFDYIIFLSAKNRRFNYQLQEIESLNNSLSTYEEVVQSLASILFNDSKENLTENEERIKSFDQKVLLIVDDFETFPEEEALKIRKFIKSNLVLPFFKVIVTTRDKRVKTGHEINTNDLNEDQCVEFLKQVCAFNHHSLEKRIRDRLAEKHFKQIIVKSTYGRPLFLMSFYTILQKHGLDVATNTTIVQMQEPQRFLFDFIYNILSPFGKDIFCIASLLVKKNDRSNKIKLLKEILDVDDDDNERLFEEALKGEMEHYNVMAIRDDVFEVLSSAIIKMMLSQYEARSESDRKLWEDRYRNSVKQEEIIEAEISDELQATGSIDTTSNDVENIADTLKKNVLNQKTILGLLCAVNKLVKYYEDNGLYDEAFATFEENNSRFLKDPWNHMSFTKSWAAFAWRYPKYKKESEKIVSMFLEKFGTIEWQNDLLVDLYGMRLFYKSRLLSMQSTDFETCEKLYKTFGKPIFNKVKQDLMSSWAPQTKHDVGLALYSLAVLLKDYMPEVSRSIGKCMTNVNYPYLQTIFEKFLPTVPTTGVDVHEHLFESNDSEEEVVDEEEESYIPLSENCLHVTGFPRQTKSCVEEVVANIFSKITYEIQEIRQSSNGYFYATVKVINSAESTETLAKQLTGRKVADPDLAYLTSNLVVSVHNPNWLSYNVHVKNLPRDINEEEFLNLMENIKPLRGPTIKYSGWGYPSVDVAVSEEVVQELIEILNTTEIRGKLLCAERYTKGYRSPY